MTHDPPPARRAWLEWLLALLATVVATWPLAVELPGLTRLGDPTLDDCIYYWNDWWVAEALGEGQNPFFCTVVYHPQGASLVLSPLAFPLAIVSIPFQLALGALHGAAVAMKLCMFVSFPLAIMGMARLLREVFGLRPWVAFAAGCLFAFVPFRMLHLGRTHYLMGALVPWFLERLVAAVRGARPWAFVGSGAVFALAASFDASLLPEMGLAALAVLGWEWGRPGAPAPRAFLVRAAGALGLGGLLFSPMLVAMVGELRANPGVDVVSQLRFDQRPDAVQLAFSPDANNLAWYLAPSLHEGLFQEGSEAALGSGENRVIWRAMHGGRPAGWISAVSALAFLALGVLAAVRGVRRELWPLVALAALGFVLALGPFRRLGENVVCMPHYWLAKVIPGLAAGRYVAAYLRLFYLAGCVLAGFGLQRVRLDGRGARLVTAALVVLGAAGFLNRRWGFRPIVHEPVYEAVAADPVPGAVVDLPHDFRPNLRRMALGQVLHRRPICGGPVTRVPPDVVRDFTEDFLPVPRFTSPPPARPADDPTLLAEVRENTALLRARDVRFVILRRRLFRDPAHRERTRAYLEAHEALSTEDVGGHLLVRVDPE